MNNEQNSNTAEGQQLNIAGVSGSIDSMKKAMESFKKELKEANEENPDGLLRLWQDGVLIVEVQDWYVPGGAFRRFYHEGVYGGAGFPIPQDQSWYVAQSYISAPLS